MRCIEILVLLWLSKCSTGCRIMGSDTGECQDPDVFLQYMPFCGPVLPYSTCIPKAQVLWYNHSSKSKDQFLSDMYNKIITQRQIVEQDKALHSAGLFTPRSLTQCTAQRFLFLQ